MFSLPKISAPPNCSASGPYRGPGRGQLRNQNRGMNPRLCPSSMCCRAQETRETPRDGDLGGSAVQTDTASFGSWLKVLVSVLRRNGCLK